MEEEERVGACRGKDGEWEWSKNEKDRLKQGTWKRRRVRKVRNKALGKLQGHK